MQLPTLTDVQEAAARIAPHVSRTPVLTSGTLDDRFGSKLFFKAENLQHSGAFKARGATNAVLSLSDESAAPGVAAHSSGNHAAALARAAKIRGIPCHIVMPHNARPNKIANVERYGATITFCDDSAAARDATTTAVIEKTGATPVHPYDAFDTIAGQGTVALELLDQVPDLDIIIVPIGGGGLAAGILTVTKTTRPDIRIIAAEPAVEPDALQSWQSGIPTPSKNTPTIADGLRAPLGTLNTAIIHQHLDAVIHASESAIAGAATILTAETRTLVESSAAVTLAALSENPGEFPASGQRIALVLTGGNVTP